MRKDFSILYKFRLLYVKKPLPLDCIGEITTFLSSSKIFFKLYILSKHVKAFYDSNSWVTQNIIFLCYKYPSLCEKVKFVSRLKFGKKISCLLEHFPNLKYLNIGMNLYIINRDIIKIKNNLKLLYLGCNSNITNDSIKELKNLTHLALDFNKAITIEGIKDLPKLTHLYLGTNSFKTEEIDMLTNLTHLHFGFDNPNMHKAIKYDLNSYKNEELIITVNVC